MFSVPAGQAIGMSIMELHEITQLEVLTFRRHILDVCQDAIAERNAGSDMARLALYKYPPNIESNADPPDHVQQAIRECE